MAIGPNSVSSPTWADLQRCAECYARALELNALDDLWSRAAGERKNDEPELRNREEPELANLKRLLARNENLTLELQSHAAFLQNFAGKNSAWLLRATEVETAAGETMAETSFSLSLLLDSRTPDAFIRDAASRFLDATPETLDAFKTKRRFLDAGFADPDLPHRAKCALIVLAGAAAVALSTPAAAPAVVPFLVISLVSQGCLDFDKWKRANLPKLDWHTKVIEIGDLNDLKQKGALSEYQYQKALNQILAS